MTSIRNIAIIGAGPAGLALGRLLHLANVPFTIFEGEVNAFVRSQGGTLDLHEDSGLLAVKKANLWDAFKRYARYDGEAFILADKHFNKVFETGGAAGEEESGGRPEIDRTRLREILLDSVPAEKIQWGKRLRSVSDDYILTFQDGSTESGFDLIVGADGAWSKVRPLLTKEVPSYTGIGGITQQITDAERKTPHLFGVVNRGSVFAFSDGQSIMAQQIGDGSLLIYSWFRADEDWAKQSGKDLKDPLQAKKYLSARYESWSPELTAFQQRADDDYVVDRLFHMLPVYHRYEHRHGATLIGDSSSHLCGPWAGEGVNVALADAMYLADAIIKSSTVEDLDANVKTFEEEMFVRGGKVQELTKANMDDLYSTEPFHTWIPRVAQRMIPQAGGSMFREGLSAEGKELIGAL